MIIIRQIPNRIARNSSVGNGTTVQNASAKNMYVEVYDVKNQCGPVVFVVLNSGSVNIALQIIC